MRIPKYLLDRLDVLHSPAKAYRARRLYEKRLGQMGIVQGTELFYYFCEGRFAFRPCDWNVVVNLKGDCAIKFVFSTYNKQQKSLVKIRVCFQGVQDIQCTLNECKISKYRDYVHSSFWKSGRKTYIAITLTSGHNEDSIIAFSYKSVSFTPL